MQTRTDQNTFYELIQEIKDLFNKNYFSNKAIPIWLRVESKAAIIKLLQILESTKFNVKEKLLKLTEYFAYRWPVIIGTDNVYNFSSHSPVTQLFLKTANILSDYGDKHPYQYLMPTVAFDKAKTLNGKKIFDYQLHEFFLTTDDNYCVVPVTLDYLFDQLVKKRRIKLDDERIISKHSVFAENYYQSIKVDKNIKTIESCQNKLSDALANSKEYIVQASYGEIGKQKIITTFAKKEKLSDLALLLCSYVNQDEWLDFLNLIPADCFFRILLKTVFVPQKNQDLIENIDNELIKLSNMSFDCKNENELKSYAICLLKTYYHARSTGEVFNSKFAYYFDSIWHTPNQKEKLDACDMLIKFILETPLEKLHDQLRDLDKFLKENGSERHSISLIKGKTLPAIMKFLTANVNKLYHLLNNHMNRTLTPLNKY